MNDIAMIADELKLEEQELLELLLEKEGLDSGRLPIPARSDRAWAPLSSTQQRLWKLGEPYRGTAFGNVDMTFRISGRFQPAAAQFALDELVRRHEILRTTFETDISTMATVQRVHPHRPVRFRAFDLRLLSPADRWPAAIRAATEQLCEPLDFERDTLLRATWIRMAEHESCLVLTSHHLALEGWGMRILLQEFSDFYAAAVGGTKVSQPPPQIQYGDFAAWEQRQLRSKAFERQRSFWAAQLSGMEPLQLPGFRTAPGGDPRSTFVPVEFDPGLTANLRRLSREREATVYTCFVALLGVMFHRYSSQTDFGIGTTISNRSRLETERLIGNFGNNLFLRVRVNGDLSFVELLDQVRETVVEAHANGDLPVEQITGAEVAGEGGSALPFDVMWVMRDGTLADHLVLPKLEVRQVPLRLGLSPVDLKIDLAEGVSEISGGVEFRKSRFSLQQIGRFRDDLIALTRAATCDPVRAVSALADSMGRTGIAKVEVQRK